MELRVRPAVFLVHGNSNLLKRPFERCDPLLITFQQISNRGAVGQCQRVRLATGKVFEHTEKQNLDLHTWHALLNSLPRESSWICKAFIGAESALVYSVNLPSPSQC